MADQFAAPPVNALISITPLSTPPANRDATSVPIQLAQATPGTVIEGFVINRDAQSNPILRTVLGDVLVKSDVFIKTGSEVVFRVDTTQQGYARILTIDGVPPQDYVAATSRGMTADTISATPLPGTSTPLAQMPSGAAPLPTNLPAMLLSTTPLPASDIISNPLLAATMSASNPIPTGLLKLQQGAALQVKLLQVALPETIAASPPRPAVSVPGSPAPQPGAQPAPATPPFTPPAQGATAQQTQTMANAYTARMAMQPPPATQSPTPTTLRPSAPPAPLPSPQATPALPPNAPTAYPRQLADVVLPPEVRSPMPASQTVQASPTPTVPAGAPPEAVPTPVAVTVAQVKAQLAPSQLPLPGEKQVPTNTPPQSAAAPVKAEGIPAQVIGHEKDGALILRSSIGTLRVQSDKALPIGTAVTLQVEPAAKHTIPSLSPVVDEEIKPLTNLAQAWSTLDEIVSTYPAQDMAIGKPLQQALPDIGPKLTSGLLFFIAAVKGGDAKQWLGPRALAALESKSPALAARLKQDMGQLQTMLIDSPLQQWNSVMVPMLYQGQLEHARLFFRDDSEAGADSNKKKAKGDQRFIVEVDLSHLGDMQFDGFVRHGERGKQFDLFVRSNQALPDALTQQIRTTFDTALQTTGFKGYLSFQHGQQHFVRPMASRETPEGGGSSQPILA